MFGSTEEERKYVQRSTDENGGFKYACVEMMTAHESGFLGKGGITSSGTTM